ncbi:MAG: S1/P1 nuclease [Chthoniobacterales bacterium]
MLRLLCVVSVLSLATQPALAWDSLGHMLVTQIAWDRLTPEAKAGVEAALARFNAEKKSDRGTLDEAYDFITASCWMDDVRGLPDKYNFGPWHYVNLPFTPAGLPEPAAATDVNVIWGINHCLEIISGRAEDPAISRDQALVMLLHLVGDIHQPLHTTNRGGDAGGNKVKVPNFELTKEEELFSQRREGNLHSFWDSAYRRGFRDGRAVVAYEAPLYDPAKPAAGHMAAREPIRRAAVMITSKYPTPGQLGPKDASAWAHESHAIGYEKGYGMLADNSPTNQKATLDEHYVNSAREVAEQRVALAGYRLADLINGLLAPAAH